LTPEIRFPGHGTEKARKASLGLGRSMRARLVHAGLVGPCGLGSGSGFTLLDRSFLGLGVYLVKLGLGFYKVSKKGRPAGLAQNPYRSSLGLGPNQP
jgi:hypothetical protein